MSETQSTAQSQPPKITRVEKTYKPKDPKRVEAGKRLAAISRSAKDRKAMLRAESSTTIEDQPGDYRDQGKILDWTVPAGGLVVAGLGALYYAFTKKQTKTETKELDDQPGTPKKLDSFDD